MKTKEFKINSWHYWFAERGGVRSEFHTLHHETGVGTIDMCTYLLCVISGLIKTLMVIIAVCIGLYIIVDTLYLLYEMSYHWKYISPSSPGARAGIGILVIGAAGLLATFPIMIVLFITDPVRKADSFISASYESIKDKYCTLITLK